MNYYNRPKEFKKLLYKNKFLFNYNSIKEPNKYCRYIFEYDSDLHYGLGKYKGIKLYVWLKNEETK